MEYIHYGSSNFDINRFEEIKNIMFFNKPIGGLWASSVDANFGWKDWCQTNNFNRWRVENSFKGSYKDQFFKFTLSDEADIYTIDSPQDVYDLPLITSPINIGKIKCPDFEKIKEIGIDAIQFNLSNDSELKYVLNSWDCDCTLILNKNIIKEIQLCV